MADLKLTSLAKSYGDVSVLKDIDLDIKSGEFGNFNSGLGNCIDGAVSFGIPQRLLQLVLFFFRGQIAAFFLKLREEFIIDRFLYNQVAVCRTP